LNNLILIGDSLVLKRKKKREYAKDLKIERGVFDKRTMLTLYDFLNKNILDEIIGITKEGKESVILAGKKGKKYVAIKIYRTEACDFKTMWKYLVGDPRFFRVKKARRSVVNTWCQREFKNLMIATKAGVACPKPIAFKENVLIMSFIGENGVSAPMLIDVILKPEDIDYVYKLVTNEMKKLFKAGLIHGDASEYNILSDRGRIVFIDFSQAVTLKHPSAIEFLKRDVHNIARYFQRQGMVISEKEIYDKIVK